MDLAIFTTPEAWISLITLIFLEIILGVDNLVFIAITTNRLPEDKQHIGRRLGLGGALIMRIVFLSLASLLVHMTEPLFTIDLNAYSHGVSIRDIVLLAGGAYLVYKGISELRDILRLSEVKAEHNHEAKKLHQLGLPQAIGTIMIMDVVFSIDSVITAVGLADHLIIMIIAVMIAVFMMMIFVDPISNFINKHPEMKILAVTFIVAIGVLLIFDSLGIHSGIEVMEIAAEKLMVYFAMVFAIILELIQMSYNKNYLTWQKSVWKNDTATQVGRVRSQMMEQLKEQEADFNEVLTARAAENSPSDEKTHQKSSPNITPVFIGSNVYIMMPVEGEDTESFKEVMLAQATGQNRVLKAPIEIDQNDIEVVDETQVTYETPEETDEAQ